MRKFLLLLTITVTFLACQAREECSFQKAEIVIRDISTNQVLSEIVIDDCFTKKGDVGLVQIKAKKNKDDFFVYYNVNGDRYMNEMTFRVKEDIFRLHVMKGHRFEFKEEQGTIILSFLEPKESKTRGTITFTK